MIAMPFVVKVLLGALLILVGGVLAVGFTEHEFLWFRGGPLGTVLMVLGVVEWGEAGWTARRRRVG
ncbi:hypothetical protein [Saccharomonospora piscinae]|uniref:hypothetical protein n=1 Tax=Saccharomonospora piscinae TaxID=687388 RepID=UPI0004BA9C3D|nr:hypothetical protein [Saccharomonospora piscinae]